MGNTQSTPPAQPPMKITKPRTNRSSTNLGLRTPAQQSAVSLSTPGNSSSSNSGEDVPTSTAGDARTHKDARQRLRTHLLSLSNLATHNGEDDSKDSPRSSGTPPRDRLSRSGSLISHVSSNRGSTTRLSSMWDSRLTLVAETSPKEAGKTTHALEALEESDPAEEAPRSTRRSSTWEPLRPELERQTVMAMRRRSMFTPGVATRGNLGLNRSTDRLSSLVAEAPKRHSIDQSPSPTTIPEPMRPAPQRPFVSSEERALTPSDQDYAHLGCFMRGSLHVTNGPASPSTINSTRQPPGQGDTASIRDGYFAIPPASAVVQKSALGSIVQLSSDLPTDVFEMGPSSPKELEKVEESSDEPPTLEAQDEGEVGRPATPLIEAAVELPSHTVHEYLAELPANPYHLETLRPVVDHLMDAPEKAKYIPYRPMVVDEGVVTTPRQSSDQLEDPRQSRLDRAPHRKPEGSSEDWPLKRAATEPASTASKASFAQREARLRADRPESSKLLAKTDSGYSSDISLKSVYELQAVEKEREGRPGLSRQGSSVYASDGNKSPRRPMVPDKAPPPVPTKMTPSPRWSLESTGTPPLPPKMGDSYQSKRMSVHMGDGSNQESAQPPPQLPPKDSWWSLGGKGTSKTTRGRSPGRRLQKPMPASVARKNGIVNHGDDMELLPVPSHGATKSTERVDSVPDTAGVARSQSIVADGKVQPEADEAKPSRKRDGSSRRRRSSIGAVLPALRRRLSSISGGLIAAESTAVKVDHETALDRLGGSAYDVASDSSSRRKSEDKARRMNKTKSMVELKRSSSSSKNDTSNNTKNSKTENKTNEEETPEKRDSFTVTPRTSSRPRPHSFHSSESIPRIDRMKKPRRPKSVQATDIPPPVPSLPAIHLQDLESGSSSNLLAPPKPPKKESSSNSNLTNGKSVGRSKNGVGKTSDLPARSAVKHRRQTSRPTPILSPSSASPRRQSVGAIPSTRGPPRRQSVGAGGSTSSNFAKLQRTHGLDLRDIPISVIA
ncbi:MAG: U2 snRNP complex subunit msl1 [Watsoniomyces obsoletus]|nr:MAG: U2 snRNP complex subunit msl1 [Watsoniomyces obsoletus]